jgi:penicillin-binding protein 2
MKTFHEKWYAGEVISVGIGQGAVAVTPIQLVRALSGIASDGHLVRPHVVDPGQLSANFRQAVLDNFTGQGEKQVALTSDTWMTVTDGMAAATTPGLYHTAEGAHLEGIDFAGKTGTAQVVGGGDTHNKGGSKTPNAWFVGMVPRRNPEIAVVVLQEHGDWGSGSAKLAAQVITAYVNKKRRQDHNLLLQADKKSAPVEMGAVWSTPEALPSRPGGKNKDVARVEHSGSGEAGMSGGHFLIPVGQETEAQSAAPQVQAPIFPIHLPGKPIVPEKPETPKHSTVAQMETGAALPERFRGVIRQGSR